jgi:hypothetical protein
MGTIGLSTDEPSTRPAQISPDEVLYVFAPRPFTADQLALLNQGKIPNDRKGAR